MSIGAADTVRRELVDLLIGLAMIVGARDYRDACFDGGVDELSQIGNDGFGTLDIERAVGIHEVALSVHICKYDFALLHAYASFRALENRDAASA